MPSNSFINMTELLFTACFRIISGAQNGAFYARRHGLGAFISVVMLFIALASMAAMPPWLPWGLAVGAAISTAGIYLSFGRPQWRYADVHLWELFATGAYTLAWCASGANILLIAAGVYPSLLLHKGLINWGGGHPFLYHGTNDATGATYALPLLGWHVPRTSLRARLVLAALSVVAAIVVLATGWAWRIYIF